MAVYTDAEWHSLCDLMGSPELAANEKFSTPAARVQNEDEIDELIGIWTAKYTRERLTEMLHKKGIAASPVYDARDLAGDAHLKERGFLTYLTHPVLGEMCTDATPIRLGASPAVIKKAAPLLGEDNHRILLDLLGMEEKDFNELVARGVIG
jgi:crotonobetainyl-CoA:carnitine CoA-transferase CaiB-like acyl-CoA transferase